MGALKALQATKSPILEDLLVCLQHILVIAKLEVYLHNLLESFETPATIKEALGYGADGIHLAITFYHSALSGSILTTS